MPQPPPPPPKQPKTVTVVHCWSAPRSRSTALCYSFEARTDCVALDEPLYAAWLRTTSTKVVSRPYRDQLLTGTAPDGCTDLTVIEKWQRERWSFHERLVQAAQQLPDTTGGVIFAKQMAKFQSVYDFGQELSLVDVDDDQNTDNSIQFIHRHLLLLRDPVAVVASWHQKGDVHQRGATVSDIGLVDLLSIYATLQSNNNKSKHATVVLDSDELVLDPEGVLQSVCEQLGIPYQEAM